MKKTNKFISRIALQSVFISDDGLHLHIEVKINELPAIMVLDTGATHTVFDIDKIEMLTQKKTRNVNGRYSAGLGASEIQSKKIKINSLQLGNYVIKEQSFTCLPLTHLNQGYQSLDIAEVIGVIGSDLMYTFGAHIDYADCVLTLFKPDKAKQLGMKNIKFIS